MLKTFFKTLAKAPIYFYRACISPYLGPRCRYQPTCSAYALEAIEKHGAGKGLLLALKRFATCHPLARRKFYDPVPDD